jgi:hypothetical protein
MKTILLVTLAFHPWGLVKHILHYPVEKAAIFYVNHIQRTPNPGPEVAPQLRTWPRNS